MVAGSSFAARPSMMSIAWPELMPGAVLPLISAEDTGCSG